MKGKVKINKLNDKRTYFIPPILVLILKHKKLIQKPLNKFIFTYLLNVSKLLTHYNI